MISLTAVAYTHLVDTALSAYAAGKEKVGEAIFEYLDSAWYAMRPDQRALVEMINRNEIEIFTVPEYYLDSFRYLVLSDTAGGYDFRVEALAHSRGFLVSVFNNRESRLTCTVEFSGVPGAPSSIRVAGYCMSPIILLPWRTQVERAIAMCEVWYKWNTPEIGHHAEKEEAGTRRLV